MKKFLSLVLALVMTMSLVTISAGAKDFKDNSSIKYKEAVDVMSGVSVIDGYADGSFGATGTLTRGAAAKIICNMILGPTTAGALSANAAPFKDVPANHTFAAYIAYCSSQGIINGYADGNFKPAGTVTGFQFLKMLLGALGYDGTIEGFTGANWTVNVAKLAVSLGLTKGNDDFVGTKAMTREEAALYGFNTMKATMVEYDTKSTVVINGVTVVTGGSKAKDVENKAVTETIKSDDKMQFAEKYFTNLKKSGGTDDFARPATTWRVKNDKIGTYTDTPDAAYATNTALNTIYADLGMSEKDTAEVYINGVAGTNVVVAKGDDTKIAATAHNNGLVGEGSTVEVFYDSDNNDVTICIIDTYAGTVVKSVPETKTKDAHIVISDEGGSISGFQSEYTTKETFEDDAVVLFTYSESAKEIKSVVLAESVEGTVSKVVAAKSVDLDGTTYKLAIQVSGDALSTSSVKNDYTLYLDKNGNVVYVKEQEFLSSDFAFVLTSERASDVGFTANRAKLLMADGTVKTVTTDKGYKAVDVDNKVVTYKANDAGEYMLRTVTTLDNSANKVQFDMKPSANSALITVKTGTNVYGNSKTVIIVKDHNNDYKTYTGIANAPTVTAVNPTGPVDAYYYCKTSGIVTFMYVDASDVDTIITNGRQDVIYLAGKSISKLTSDKNGDYYLYNAVINGEITTIMVDSSSTNDVVGIMTDGKLDVVNALFGSASYDSYKVASSFTVHADAATAIGTVKLSGDYTVGLGVAPVVTNYTVSEKAGIYKVDLDGNITAVDLKSIRTDDNDTVVFTMKDGEINNLFVQEVKPAVAPTSADVTLSNMEVGMTLNFNGQSSVLTGTSKTFTGLTAGTYTYTLAMAGYATYTGSVTVTTANYGTTIAVTAPTYYTVTNGTSGLTMDGMSLSLNTAAYTKVYAGFDLIATVTGTQAANSVYFLTKDAADVHKFVNTTGAALGLGTYTYTAKVTDNATYDLVKGSADVKITLPKAGMTITVDGNSHTVVGTTLSLTDVAMGTHTISWTSQADVDNYSGTFAMTATDVVLVTAEKEIDVAALFATINLGATEDGVALSFGSGFNKYSLPRAVTIKADAVSNAATTGNVVTIVVDGVPTATTTNVVAGTAVALTHSLAVAANTVYNVTVTSVTP